MKLEALCSGGQTGVDQAALRVAQRLGLRTVGWCPPGSVCERGTVLSSFGLRETPRELSDLAPRVPRSLRTEWNVRDSDATLVLTAGPGADDAGSRFTIVAADYHAKPHRVAEIDESGLPKVKAWLLEVDPSLLNVAGPSESFCPGVGQRAEAFLLRLLRPLLLSGEA